MLALANQLVAEYETNSEQVELEVDEKEEKEDLRLKNVRQDILSDWEGYNGSFAAFAKLYQTNPEITTVEGLGRLDIEIDFMIDGKQVKEPTFKTLNWDIVGALLGANDIPLLRRICAAPTEFIDEQGSKQMEPQPDDDKAIAFIKAFMSKDDMARMGFRMRVNDEIRKFQQMLNISGLTDKEFSCRGFKIDYLTEYGSALVPRDERKLQRQVPKVSTAFLQLAAMGNPKYKLSRVDFDNEEYGDRGEEIPTTYTQIREYAERAKAAWIYHESIEWEDKLSKVTSTTRGEMGATMGHYVDRPKEPDTIELHLTMGWKDFRRGNISDSIIFRLSHPHRD
ncbi:MAG: hypothetical protein HC815_36060 [Richelia sp. RM1_1_1]|nr:hypothetical protein [Richelia sp. RM1_1_1]